MIRQIKGSILSGLVAGLLAAGPAFGQQVQVTTVPGAAGFGFGEISERGQVVQRATPPFNDTRNELLGIMARYPPKLGLVLAIDPTLLGNADFLSTYPELRGFLQRHPEIARDPDFFIRGRGNVLNSMFIQEPPREPQTASQQMWSQFLRTLQPVVISFAALAVVLWILRTVIDHRRWLRVSRIQTEAHTKLMDRLTNNEDLLAYLQTPAGKGFFDMSAIPTDFGPTRSAAPVTRILWSVQIGMVLLFGGAALQWSSGSISPEASEPIGVISVLGIALGASFILGAGASYLISDKLGLLEKRVRRESHTSQPSTPPS